MADSSLLTKTSSNKNKSWSASYEPEATNLVIQIQDSTNVQAKARLMEDLFKLITPFVIRTAGQHLKFYAKLDAEDVAQEFMFKNIMDNDSEHWNTMCLYRYDRLYKDNDGSHAQFCTFMEYYIMNFCRNWNRKFSTENNHHGPSLNFDIKDAAELMRGLQLEYEISMNQSELDKFKRNFDEFLPVLVIAFQKFFDAVNSLDKDKTYGKPFQDGEKVVNEQKLLAYHIRFINEQFRLLSNIKKYSAKQVRTLSYTQVNHKNNKILQNEVFRVTTDFMKLLEERIISRNLTDSVFLPPEKNIKTTVNEWLRAPTMKKRVDAEYAATRAEAEVLRKEYFYETRV